MNTVLIKEERKKSRCNRRGGGDGDKSWISRIGGTNGSDGVGICYPDIREIGGEVRGGHVTIHAQVDEGRDSSTMVSPRVAQLSA